MADVLPRAAFPSLSLTFNSDDTQITAQCRPYEDLDDSRPGFVAEEVAEEVAEREVLHHLTETPSWTSLGRGLQINVYAKLLRQLGEPELVGEVLELNALQLSELQAGFRARVIRSSSVSAIWEVCARLSGSETGPIDRDVLHKHMPLLLYASHFEHFSETAIKHMAGYLKDHGIDCIDFEGITNASPSGSSTIDSDGILQKLAWKRQADGFDCRMVQDYLSAGVRQAISDSERAVPQSCCRWIQDGIAKFDEEDSEMSISINDLSELDKVPVICCLQQVYKKLKKCKLRHTEPNYLLYCFGPAVYLSARLVREVDYVQALLRSSYLTPTEEYKIVNAVEIRLMDDLNEHVQKLVMYANARCQVEKALAIHHPVNANNTSSSLQNNIPLTAHDGQLMPSIRSTPWRSDHIARTIASAEPARSMDIDTQHRAPTSGNTLPNTMISHPVQPASHDLSSWVASSTQAAQSAAANLFNNLSLDPALFHTYENINTDSP